MFLAASDGPCPVLQAPESLAVAAAMNNGATLHLLVVRDSTGEIIGLQPVQRGSLSVRFKTRKKTWFTIPTPGVSLIGTEPLTTRKDLKPIIVRSILHFLRDEKAVEFRELKTDDPIESEVVSFAKSAHGFHRAGYRSTWRYAYVPASVGAYNTDLGKKKAYNLRRQDRILMENLGGDLNLKVVRDLTDLNLVVEAINQITGWSPAMLRWATRDAELSCREAVACFFVVRCNQRLVGLVRATTWGNILHVHSMHHDNTLEKFSPGTVSWQAVIRWVIEGQTIRRIVFAYGAPARGNKPASVAEERSHVFIYKRGVWTSTVIQSHRLFVACKTLGSRFMLGLKPSVSMSATANATR